jgi:hypothetical protein
VLTPGDRHARILGEYKANVKGISISQQVLGPKSSRKILNYGSPGLRTIVSSDSLRLLASAPRELHFSCSTQNNERQYRSRFL